MASDEEDVDLQTLRNQVLATLKSCPSKDDDDLESLRQAALYSKKSVNAESNILPQNDVFHHPILRQAHHNDIFCWRRPNSNLIEIKPLPIDVTVTTNQSIHSENFRPFNSSRFHSRDETLSQPTLNKVKSSSKFSRFESDSDSDSDSDFEFPVTSSSVESEKEDDESAEEQVKRGETPHEENSLDQNDSQSSDKENEDNDSIPCANDCDESDATVPKDCDKNDSSNVNPVSVQTTSTREETTRHQRITIEDDTEEKSVVEQDISDSDRAKMEARKRKFESQQCVIPDKSRKISLKQIVNSTKDSSLDCKLNSDSEETSTRGARSNRRSEPNRNSSNNRITSLADTSQDLRVGLRQRKEERKNGKRKRRRRAKTPSPTPASPVIKSVLSIVKVELQKKRRKDKRADRSRRNKSRKKSQSPHANEELQTQNGTKLPVRLRLGRPVNNKKDGESASDQSSLLRKREDRKAVYSSTSRRSTSRSIGSTGISDPNSAGDSQFTVNYDLEAKIRRIREQNRAIMRRREEVAADRKKHS